MHAITNSGWIEVVTGSMFSGKTEELLRRLRRAEIAGQDVAVFTPAIDDRYGKDAVGSHDGRRWEAIAVEPDSDFDAVNEHLNGEKVVAFDEGNFFTPALVECCERLAGDGRRVIVSGLDLNFRGEPYKPMPQLIAVAEYVEKFRAICTQCGEPATRTQRMINGEPAHVDDPTTLVGAEESYEARCRHCHTIRRD
ncbi:thymidine kinase [Halobacteria archaeon AArc-curdl1]|uniref:Thymidine kinase n=1 Tax=Natronosalvus hydrolyticus TaxID=2979988 RepID=A0AAP3E9E0_9EURY|nr:thymidine kinase [Halobacteria archaeon AArc-curdl1]